MIAAIRGILIACLFLCAMVGATERSDYFPPPDTSGGWRTATNVAQVRESADMDLPRLEQAWEFTQRCTQNAGLLVVRNGWLVFEKYVERASRNANPDMASTGKAYTSIACGIMLQEFREKIPEGLDTKVFTPKFLPEAYDPTLTDVPQPEASHERDDWKPIPGTPFIEGSRGGDDGIRRVLEMAARR